MGEPVLSDDKLGEFAKAVAADEGASTEETTSEAATSSGTSAEETATPPTQEQATETAGGDTVADESTEAVPKGPIPYERFSQVNVERKQALEKIREYERQLADVDQTAKARTAVYLEQIAALHPELKSAIYGKQAVEEGAPAREAENPPEDPKEKRIWELEKQTNDLQRYRREQERERMLDAIETRCDSAMEKHPVFKNPKVREIAERLIANDVIAQPNVPPEKVVDTIAAQLRAYEEEIKASYKQAKVAPTKAVPKGVGPAGGAPPGQGSRPLKLGDGSAMRALAAALKGETQE